MFEVRFDTESKEFKECPVFEIERILKKIVRQARDGHTWGSITDYNGDLIGTWKFKKEVRP